MENDAPKNDLAHDNGLITFVASLRFHHPTLHGQLIACLRDDPSALATDILLHLQTAGLAPDPTDAHHH